MCSSAISKLIVDYVALLLFIFATGCESPSNISMPDRDELRSILVPYRIVKRCHSLEKYGEAETAIEELVNKLNSFCKNRKIGKSAILEATNVQPILDDDIHLVFVFAKYSCSISGVIFVFNNSPYVTEVQKFTAME